LTSSADRDGWQLVEASDRDLDELMSWFHDAAQVDVWGGPRFRFPFTRATFRKDCRWGRMPGFRLNSPAGEFSAFGQMYQRYGRINFARLVVKPGLRGQGVGRKLVGKMIEEGPKLFPADEFSLFAYRHNTAALACYRSMGFVVRDYPQGARMADQCYYLTRPIQQPDRESG
jgi:ribosomal protein S18 acetylase RimI-like enzyme